MMTGQRGTLNNLNKASAQAPPSGQKDQVCRKRGRVGKSGTATGEDVVNTYRVESSSGPSENDIVSSLASKLR